MIELIHTCTIDNILTILHIHFKSNEKLLQRLTQRSSPAERTLKQTMTLFRSKVPNKFDEGKLSWVDFLQNHPISSATLKITSDDRGAQTIDLYGTTSDFVVDHFRDVWKLTATTACSLCGKAGERDITQLEIR